MVAVIMEPMSPLAESPRSPKAPHQNADQRQPQGATGTGLWGEWTGGRWKPGRPSLPQTRDDYSTARRSLTLPLLVATHLKPWPSALSITTVFDPDALEPVIRISFTFPP